VIFDHPCNADFERPTTRLWLRQQARRTFSSGFLAFPWLFSRARGTDMEVRARTASAEAVTEPESFDHARCGVVGAGPAGLFAANVLVLRAATRRRRAGAPCSTSPTPPGSRAAVASRRSCRKHPAPAQRDDNRCGVRPQRPARHPGDQPARPCVLRSRAQHRGPASKSRPLLLPRPECPVRSTPTGRKAPTPPSPSCSGRRLSSRSSP
jgi:hypothetical protein